MFTQETVAVATASNNKISYGIVKIFPFESHLKRMSVVCETTEGGFIVCCKGAPEVIAERCVTASLPPDFDDVLASYSTMGFRVLGLASKALYPSSDPHTTPRGELERDMVFHGLLVLSNRLKPESRSVREK